MKVARLWSREGRATAAWSSVTGSAKRRQGSAMELTSQLSVARPVFTLEGF